VSDPAIPPWYAEAVLCGDRSVLQPPCATPFDLDQHPYRVLVYGERDKLLLVGTCRAGTPDDEYLHARRLLDHAREQHHADSIEILDRTTHQLASCIIASAPSED
jgi:hypothetical protein